MWSAAATVSIPTRTSPIEATRNGLFARLQIADLDEHGHGDRVLTMSFSEFGRRLKENASEGTDHGAEAELHLRYQLHQPTSDLQDDPKSSDGFSLMNRNGCNDLCSLPSLQSA